MYTDSDTTTPVTKMGIFVQFSVVSASAEPNHKIFFFFWGGVRSHKQTVTNGGVGEVEVKA